MSWITNFISSGSSINCVGESTVTINGKTYKGQNIVVQNGKVTIDGKPADDYSDNNQQHTFR